MTKTEITKAEIRIVHIRYPLINQAKVSETIRTQTLDVFYYRNNKSPKAKRLHMWTDWRATEDELEIKNAVRDYLASLQ
jgi:hypothetical protein